MSDIERLMALIVADIVAERERQGISQQQLSDMTGIAQSAISRIESLKGAPQLDTLLVLADALGLALSVSTPPKGNELPKYTQTFSAIRCDIQNSNIAIRPADGDSFFVQTTVPEEFTFAPQGDVLYLTQKKYKLLKILFSLPETVLYVPHSFCGDLYVQNQNGALDVYNQSVQNLDLNNTNGAILTQSCSSSGVYLLKSTNGAIRIENCRGKDIEAKSTNGALRATALSFRMCSFGTTNGKNVLTDVACEQLSATATNGRIRAYGIMSDAIKLSTQNGSIMFDNLCGKNLTLSTGNGTAIGVVGANQSEYELEAKTGYGKVHIGSHQSKGGFLIQNPHATGKIVASSGNGSIKIAFLDTEKSLLEEIRQKVSQKNN